MATISQQITALKQRRSHDQIRRAANEARRKAATFRGHQGDHRQPGSIMDPGFLRTLEARRVAVEQRSPSAPTPEARIAQLRAAGQLPPVEQGPDRPEYAPAFKPVDALKRALGLSLTPAPEDKVGYEPTPEEVLGDAATPHPTAPPVPRETDESPPPEEVLRGAPAVDTTDTDDDDGEPMAAPIAPAAAAFEGTAYLAGDLTPEELAEIDRMNPRRAATAPAPAPVARPGRPVHTGKQRQRGR